MKRRTSPKLGVFYHTIPIQVILFYNFRHETYNLHFEFFIRYVQYTSIKIHFLDDLIGPEMREFLCLNF